MKRLILFAVVLLTACATPYQETGLTGGYSDTQLAENVFRVSFRGNGITSLERASDFAMLRAADLTLENGYRYFVVASSSEGMNQETYTTPVQTTGSVDYYGNSASFSSTTTGGQVHTISKPRTSYLVTCYKDKPTGSGVVFDAQFLERSLREKYGLK